MKTEVKVTKITRVVEQEIFQATCPKCKKVIQGSTENQVVFNMSLHQAGKSCFEQRVQNELPERTPGYVSQKDENLHKEDKE